MSSLKSRSFDDENYEVSSTHAGTLLMAQRRRHDNRSSFAVTLHQQPELQGRALAFGHVLRGHRALLALSMLPVGNPEPESEGEEGMPASETGTIPPHTCTLLARCAQDELLGRALWGHCEPARQRRLERAARADLLPAACRVAGNQVARASRPAVLDTSAAWSASGDFGLPGTHTLRRSLGGSAAPGLGCSTGSGSRTGSGSGGGGGGESQSQRVAAWAGGSRPCSGRTRAAAAGRRPPVDLAQWKGTGKVTCDIVHFARAGELPWTAALRKELEAVSTELDMAAAALRTESTDTAGSVIESVSGSDESCDLIQPSGALA